MKLIALVASDLEGAIGKAGGLPWRLPSDLARFRKRTMGGPVIMGSRTFQSIGRPLDGRLNIILSRKQDFSGVIMARDPQGAIAACGNVEEAFVIGGGQIYSLFQLDTIELTEVQTVVDDADTFFAIPDEMDEVSRSPATKEEGDQHSWALRILQRTQ